MQRCRVPTCPSPASPNVNILHDYIIIIKMLTKNINIGTVLLTKLQALFRFPQCFH